MLLSGEVIGETVRYSVAQYCYAVLSNPENDETLISLAEDLLAYGASAQARLIKIGNIADEPLVTEYGYAYAGVSGVSFGGYGSTLVAPDERVVPTYSGSDKVVSWNVTVGGETLNYSLEEAATGIPVSDIAKFVPVFVVSEGFNDDPNVYLDSTNEVYYKNSGVATPVVTTDPANAANKVLQIGGNGSTTKEEVHANLSETVEGANRFTFSTKIYFAKPVNSSKELIRFNFVGVAVSGLSQITLNTVYNDNSFNAFVKHGSAFLTDAEENKVVLNYETWYDFQVELIVLDNETGAAKVVVSVAGAGEELLKILELDATITSTAKAPTSMRIQRTASTANTAVYIDDTILMGKKI